MDPLAGKVRLPTPPRRAPEPSPTKTGDIDPRDVLVLAETTERNRFELRRNETILGRLTQQRDVATLTLGDERLTVRTGGKALALTTADGEVVARLEDRLLRSDRIVLAGAPEPFPFEDDERLTEHKGEPIARFVARNPSSHDRIVRIEIADHLPALAPDAVLRLVAFAACVVLVRRLPPRGSRGGTHTAQAGDSTGVTTGGI
jgi:hypothetical protein